ncbi:MAG: thioredoxin family protein [Balneolaceae bacterium]
MKSIVLILTLVFGSYGLNYEWLTDLNEAKKAAAEEDRTIILVFQGSDWCGPCIKLSREVWDTEVFQEYAEDNFVMLQADFPKRKKNALTDEQHEKNNKLAEQYNPNGHFPFVVVMDKEGNVLGETGYNKMKTVEFIELLESF